MADAEDRLWMDVRVGGKFVLAAFDIGTLAFIDSFDLPVHTHGMSIDFDGRVWGMGFNDPRAFRIDPITRQMDIFTGLVQPDTYSDMTGFALANVEDPPES